MTAHDATFRQPHQHPFLTSSYRSLPMTNKPATSSSESSESHQENSCDAIFYYQVVEKKVNYDDRVFEVLYSCEFWSGSPGFVIVHECFERGRCMFPRLSQNVKTCWREFSPEETCTNCTKIVKESRMMQPFVPVCVLREASDLPRKENGNMDRYAIYDFLNKLEMEDGNRVVKGTPLHIGFPTGFDISRPDIRTWDDEDDEESGGNERMIRMHVFEEVQLVNSVLQVTCDSSSYYTDKHFIFALKLQNKTKLEFLSVPARPRLATLPTGHISTQTISLRLNETELELELEPALVLEVERIFCFAHVQNSFKRINASRPLRILPDIQDLFKPGHFPTSNFNPQLQSHPALFVQRNNLEGPKLYIDVQNDTEWQFDDTKYHITCEAKYPIELIHNSTYHETEKVYVGTFKYSTHHVSDVNGTLDFVHEFSTMGFNYRAGNYSQFFRCQSIENPCLHRSFQFFYPPTAKQNQSGEKSLTFRNFAPGGKMQTVQTELGRPANYQECQALFLYREISEFPFYEFRCEVSMGQRGTINFQHCDSINECKNIRRNRRQSPKCWRKVESWRNCNRGCQIKRVDSFRPFVATCTFDRHLYKIQSRAEEPRYEESTLGSFAVFELSRKPNETAPIYFSEEELDPQKMTHLEPFGPYQFPETHLNVTCTVSGFYINAQVTNVKIAKYFAQRDEFKVVRGTQQDSYNTDRHYFTVTQKVDLGNDSDLSHIYCIGNHWKGSNSSRKIHVHVPEFPEIAIHVADSKGERIFMSRGKIMAADQEPVELFPLSSTNVSLVCHGYGYPPPEILWTTSAANKPKAESTVVNVTHSLSRIVLTVIDVGVEGTYICTATNNQRNEVLSSVKVGIKYPVSKTVVVISAVASFIFFIFVIVLLLFVRRNRKLKQTLRDLSDDEVKHFRFGDKTGDPTDNNAEIYALEYDQSLEVAPNLIEIDEKSLALGAGEFGIVRRGFLKSSDTENENESGVPVAIKMPKFNVTTENFISFLQEIKIMSYVQNHENVLKILGATTVNIKKRQALIALEFCELGDLKNFLRGRKGAFRNEFLISSLMESEQSEFDFSGAGGDYGDPATILPDSDKFQTLDLLNFSLGIANGMNFLAEKKVIHGDLAARNVLLTWNREVKISDFGFSTQLKNYQTYAKTNSIQIPWRWFPIEALVDRKFTLKSDCWSYGILLYEIFSLGEDPYPGFERLEPKLVQSLRGGYRSEKPEFANDDIFELMSECWRKDPNERPTFTAICDKIVDMSIEVVGPKLNLM